METVKALFSRKEIQTKFLDIAQIIDTKFQYDEDVVILGILDGCYPFLTDLTNALNIPYRLETIHFKSYSGKTEHIHYDHIKSISKETSVIIVDDMYDSGKSMNTVSDLIYNAFDKPHIIKYCPLISRREIHDPRVISNPLIVGNDNWLYGYGLDKDGYQRNNENIFEIIKQ